MILTMGISLYTSRVILNALGVEDYGVYNVVGGVVSMLAFFISSIGSSTQRFLNVGMADKSNGSLTTIFTSSLNVHVIIGVIAVILMETVGLWFVVNKLVIPVSQKSAALWVYQCSVLSFFISIISAPYNAALVAYEKMSAFAILSIIEVLLKLGVAFIIMFYPGERLQLYAIMILGIAVIMRFCNSIYCSYTFKDIRYRWEWNTVLIKKMLSFSGWMIFGCLTDILGSQGVNMMINIFFGPVFNASRAIAIQVKGAVSQFSTNFIISVNPQIAKSYAAKDFNHAFTLTFTASRLSFYLMMLITIPFILRSEQILTVWLKTVPLESSLFVNLILIEFLIRSSYNPIAQINQASGNIRLYQLIISCLFLLNFAVTYILFKIGYPVYSTFILSIAIAIIGLIARVMVLHYQQSFPAMRYLKEVSLKIFFIAIISFILNYLINTFLPQTFGGLSLFVSGSLLINIFLIWQFGLNRREKEFMTKRISSIRQKITALI